MLNLNLKNVELKSRVLLAPMAGITDLPFRKIVREFGNFLMFSEMIASQAMIRHVKKTYKMLEGADDEFTSVQIVGADPLVMADAAKLCRDLGAKFIDINMGCPVKKIVKSDSGSALMKNEKLAAKILEYVVKAVDIPVTLKMRLGWDLENQNASNIAQIAENSGIQLVTVHGRTRSQLYAGNANWAAIKNVKDNVKIPVIANGNIVDINSATRALKESCADGIMIGRGALGKPWLLNELHCLIENTTNTIEFDRFSVITKHIRSIFDFYPENTAIKMARKVLISYCKGEYNSAKYRQQLNTTESKDEITELIQLVFS